MMDDLTYLAMKLFKESQQWIWQYSISNIINLRMFIVEKNNGIEKEGVLKSYFLDLPLYKTPGPIFFLVPWLSST